VTLTDSTIPAPAARRQRRSGRGPRPRRSAAGGSFIATTSTLETTRPGLWANQAAQVGLGGFRHDGNPLAATVKGNGFGVVLRGTPMANFNAYLQNVELDGNRGLGLALDGMGYAYVQMSQIRDTMQADFPGETAARSRPRRRPVRRELRAVLRRDLRRQPAVQHAHRRAGQSPVAAATA